MRDGSVSGYERGVWTEDCLFAVDELELGSLVAALSAETEDETELDDRIRLLVESGLFRIAVGCGPGVPALRN